MTSTFPPLPHADKSGRVAVALDNCVLLPSRVRLRRGDSYAIDDPIVVAHPAAFTTFTPPPLDP